MQAVTKRKINTSREYDFLFPAARNVDKTVVKNAQLEDTIAFIHKVVGKTLNHTKDISEKLKGNNTYETSRNIWNFVYKNVAYKKDEDGLEQVRSPRRTWRDRKTGVDCDCYSTFISSILTNLKIPHKLRITKYRSDHFQHVYPIVPYNGRLIIIDCVTDQFDYEVPYSENKDINMDLQYLDGINGADLGERGNDIVFDGVGELGKFGFLKKIVKVVNKVNPATVLLRNGFLAAMKLNLFKVASRIKYAYLTPDQAVKRGIIKDKYDKLVKIKQKMESIFSTAGGNPKNLKKAILNGKGNKNKEVVAGLGFLGPDDSVAYMNQNTSLSQLLGKEIFYDENIRGMEGFEGLGGVGDLGSLGAAPFVAAAAAAIAALAKLIKGVGNIFGGKEKGSEDFSETETAAADQEVAQTPAATNTTLTTTASPSSSAAPSSSYSTAEDTSTSEVTSSMARVANVDNSTSVDTSDYDVSATDSAVSVTSSSSLVPTSSSISAANTASSDTSSQTFWQKNKKWLLPAALGVGGIAVIAIGMKLMKPAPPAKKTSLNGPPKKKNHHRKTTKRSKKSSITLL